MEKLKKEIKDNRIVLVLIILTFIGSFLFNQFMVKDYSRINNETTKFVSARVNQIISQNTEYNEKLQTTLGKQVIEIEFLEGKREGDKVEIDNFVTAEHNVEVKEGSKIIVSADEPDNIEPYYTVYSFDQSLGMLVFTIILFLVVITIGKGKGVKSIIGLCYTLYLVVYLLLPTVFSGYSPVLMTVIVVICSTSVTLLLLNGNSKKTYSAVIATILGVVISAISFYIMSLVFQINGFSTDEAESLVLINQVTGLQIKDVLFSGILISSLGAIMDVGMSIVSALYEVHSHNSSLTSQQLFHSGIEIGKDMIGTMTNTLILAFTGSAFVSLLVLFSFNVNMTQLLNSNFLVMEFIQGIAGTLGIVLTVPIASFISSVILKDSYTFFKSMINHKN